MPPVKRSAKQRMHLDDPDSFRIWTCKFWVRTACTSWLTNENGVTKVEAEVTCPACLAIIANRGQEDLFKAAEERSVREATSAKVADARRAAMARKRAKILADQEAREKRTALVEGDG